LPVNASPKEKETKKPHPLKVSRLYPFLLSLSGKRETRVQWFEPLTFWFKPQPLKTLSFGEGCCCICPISSFQRVRLPLERAVAAFALFLPFKG